MTLGESVSEAMSSIPGSTATNDHALRAFQLALPWLGKVEIGNSGFRFAKVELFRFIAIYPRWAPSVAVVAATANRSSFIIALFSAFLLWLHRTYAPLILGLRFHGDAVEAAAYVVLQGLHRLADQSHYAIRVDLCHDRKTPPNHHCIV